MRDPRLPDRPWTATAGRAGLAVAAAVSALCAAAGTLTGYPHIYVAAWAACAVLAATSCVFCRRRRWPRRGYPTVLLAAAVAVCAAGQPAGLVCGAPAVAAITICTIFSRKTS